MLRYCRRCTKPEPEVIAIINPFWVYGKALAGTFISSHNHFFFDTHS
jgi:hypothetical protein